MPTIYTLSRLWKFLKKDKFAPNPAAAVKRFGIFKNETQRYFFVIWKVLEYKYYRSDLLQLANGILVPLRFAIRRHAGSNPCAVSHEVTGSKPLPFLHYLFEMFFSLIGRIGIR